MNKLYGGFYILLLLSLQACSTYYSAEPINAQVIDAETNQPVEGVMIVAHWQLEGGLEGGTNLGQMKVMEAVTDQAGKFSFPAWGPEKVPSDFSWVNSNARLKNMDPEILLFKRGYQVLRLENNRPLSQLSGMKPYVRTSEWNRKTIKMQGLGGALRKEFQSAEAFSSLLRFTDNSYSPCAWRDIPRTIAMLVRLNAIFESEKLGSISSLPHFLASNEKQFASKGCGSTNDFLRDIQK